MKTSWRFLCTILLLCAALLAAKLSERRQSDYLAQPLENIDASIAGWQAAGDAALGARVLKILLPTSYLSRTYRKKDLQLGLFIAFYAQQKAGESMHSPKHCLPGNGWEIWNYDTARVPLANGTEVKVNKYSIYNANQRMVMLYWYQSKQRIIASEYLGKILLVRDALVDGRTAASIVRVTVPDVPGSTNEAIDFSSRIIPEVQRCFGG
jgi:EpsI family protein